MESGNVSRRKFLNVAAIGTTAFAASRIVKAAGGESPAAVPKTVASEPAKAGAPKLFICSICGHVSFGSAPDTCPVCHAAKENFNQNDALFTDAQAKTSEGAGKHLPVITLNKKSTLIADLPCKEIAVRIGKTLHPMEDAHHIRFVDCYVDDKFIERLILTAGALPAVTFYAKAAGAKVRIVELCSVHGYWQAEA
jgi:desulfoferrodoxin-like iron-binding protein